MSVRSKLIYLTIIIMIMLSGLLITIANNCVAKKTKRDIEAIPLPERTERIEALSSAGKLVGSGNGMQYFGAVLIKSGLSLEELDAHYSQYREKEDYYIVEPQTNQKIKATENQLSFEHDINGDDYYIVYSWGDTKYEFLYYYDIRGH